jgi:hypothetical protein
MCPVNALIFRQFKPVFIDFSAGSLDAIASLSGTFIDPFFFFFFTSSHRCRDGKDSDTKILP